MMSTSRFDSSKFKVTFGCSFRKLWMYVANT
ncbi:hypothetical protein V12B01_12710 [Vibrio splendidus 12B01]|nr:hypothetical protein V12B01_12710 [Vibrio splendidus 12B01]EAQ54935.1 hypothetical protein MED222_04955 [Vibrio sp. MED222]